MMALVSVLWLILGVILQVLVFNHLSVMGGVGFFYLGMLLKLPVDMPRWLQILIGFLAGLSVDVFCNTPGMNALTATTVMWLRIPLLHMFVIAEDFKSGVPSVKALGVSNYSKFAFTLIIIFCAMLYIIEAFTLCYFWGTLLKIIISIVLTSLLSLVVEIASNRSIR